METRWNDITYIWKDWRGTYELGGGITLVLIFIWIGSLLFAADAGYGTNLYTEAIGVLVTIAVLNTFARQREQAQLKNRLVREAGSRDNSTAVSAIDWMRHEGWLRGENGLLKGADLRSANLENADLCGVNLRGTDLNRANLQNTLSIAIKLTEADLTRANLAHADMTHADLRGAHLGGVNLTHADLRLAKLKGANLFLANLLNANVNYVRFDEKTVLPDAQSIGKDSDGKHIFDKHWTPDTDMRRYADPNHPDYWQPEWAKKPSP